MSAEELYFFETYHADTPEHIQQRLNRSDRSVVLLEQGKKIGFGFESGTSWPVLGDLNRLGVPFLKQTAVTAITKDGVEALQTAKDGSQSQMRFPCDCVVVASGVHADSSLLDAIRAKGIPAVAIGNADRLGKAIDAIRAGCEVGYDFVTHNHLQVKLSDEIATRSYITGPSKSYSILSPHCFPQGHISYSFYSSSKRCAENTLCTAFAFLFIFQSFPSFFAFSHIFSNFFTPNQICSILALTAYRRCFYGLPDLRS